MLSATTPTSVTLSVGGLWLIAVETLDLDGMLVASTPAVTVTKPDGSTVSPTFETVTAGVYRVTYTTTAAGRHVAHVTTTDDAVDFAVYAYGPTTEAGMPTANDCVAYIKSSSYTTAEIQGALDAERAAQRARCGERQPYPADLREALLRRVQRNLAMRRLPLAVNFADADGGSTILPGRDPEVRRLEGPYRRLVIG